MLIISIVNHLDIKYMKCKVFRCKVFQCKKLKSLKMSEKSVSEFISTYNKWKNIQYDFNVNNSNCSLNVNVGNTVKDNHHKF